LYKELRLQTRSTEINQEFASRTINRRASKALAVWKPFDNYQVEDSKFITSLPGFLVRECYEKLLEKVLDLLRHLLGEERIIVYETHDSALFMIMTAAKGGIGWRK
jgi:hypothetical protein